MTSHLEQLLYFVTCLSTGADAKVGKGPRRDRHRDATLSILYGMN